MLHLRIVSPLDRTEAVLGLLRGDPGVTNVALLPGAALEPSGDLLLCDIVREGANRMLTALRDLGVHLDGSMALVHVDVSVSDAAQEAASRVPGYGSDAAVWEEVDARVRDESTLTAGFLVLLVIASLIAAIGLFEDAPILIVGAMVVGPEYGPIAGLSAGLFKRRPRRMRTAAATLAVGLTAGAATTYLATALADGVGLVPNAFSPHVQPLTGFIVDPSVLSFVVAFLAGIAGTLSLTQAKASALTGVLISVTTIPAVAAIGVSGALGSWQDARGATIQLLLNLLALILAGVLTLWAQREAWDELVPHSAGDQP
ncbi:MAG: DUF389 domain-containing protein [Acidimicrobiales bacterium]